MRGSGRDWTGARTGRGRATEEVPPTRFLAADAGPGRADLPGAVMPLVSAVPDAPEVSAAVGKVWKVLERADRVFFTWRADSDVMRIRRGELDDADADPWVAEMRDLCARAERAAGGLFTTDLVGPDGTRAWDPTGLVKGWAVEQAAAALRAVPGIAFSINAGVDILCDVTAGGPAEPWRIGIEDPREAGSISAVVQVTVGALAASGTAARGGHIVDPRTGAAASGVRGSVTVTGPSLTWADMWATVSLLDEEAPGRAQAATGAWGEPGDWGDYRVAWAV